MLKGLNKKSQRLLASTLLAIVILVRSLFEYNIIVVTKLLLLITISCINNFDWSPLF